MTHSRRDLDEFVRLIGGKTPAPTPVPPAPSPKTMQSLAHQMRRRGIRVDEDDELDEVVVLPTVPEEDAPASDEVWDHELEWEEGEEGEELAELPLAPTPPVEEDADTLEDEATESAPYEEADTQDEDSEDSFVEEVAPHDVPASIPRFEEPAPAVEAEPDPIVESREHIAPDSFASRQPRLHSDMCKIAEAVSGFSDKQVALLEGIRQDGDAEGRSVVCQPMRFFETHGMLSGDVLDYGSGRDPHEFARYDPHYAEDHRVFGRRWKTVTCNYVLDSMLNEGQRTSALLALRGLVSSFGKALVSVRRTDISLIEGYERQRVNKTQQEWTEYLGQFWEVEQLDTTKFWSWSLRHPANLIQLEQAQHAAPPPQITVGPIVINTPELPELQLQAPITVQPAAVTVPVQVDAPITVKNPAPKLEVKDGAVQVDVHVPAPKNVTKVVSISKDGRGGVKGTMKPVVEEDDDVGPAHPEVAKYLNGSDGS